MRKLILATALVGIVGATAALAQTPQPQPAPQAQTSQSGMMGSGMMGSDGGCPMMKRMASMEERLKKLEQAPPKQ